MDLVDFSIFIASFFPFLLMHFTKKYFYFSFFGVIVAAIHGYYLFGPNILFLLLITYIISTIAELVSLKTAINLFGVKYVYNLNNSYFSSRVALMGVYPIEVSFTWVLLKYVSFNIALLIVSAFSISNLWLIFITPLILVSLDFIIDPIAVIRAKMWKWEKGSSYFGIPYGNFVGWYIVGLISSVTFYFFHINPLNKFDILLILPIIFYAAIVKNTSILYKIDKPKGLIVSTPAILWTTLGTISLLLIWFRT